MSSSSPSSPTLTIAASSPITPTTATTLTNEPNPNSERKRILVTGATGKQGLATVRALLRLNSPSKEEEQEREGFHVLALTRNAKSKAAQELVSLQGQGQGEVEVEVVEGDLTDEGSIRDIFERYACRETGKGEGEREGGKKEKGKGGGGGIWGVFSVQAFPGLGVDAGGEEAQGKLIATLASEYGVSHFIYSSSERAEEIYDEEAKPGTSHEAKVRIERRVMELGLPGWTILRPVRFMENFGGPLGGITFAVFKAGLKRDTKMDLVAVDDVGQIAAEVFRNPTPYTHKILVPIGDALTCTQVESTYKKVTNGRTITKVPGLLASGLLGMNRGTRDVITSIERPYEAMREGLLPNLESQVELARVAFVGGGAGGQDHLTTFEEWVGRQRSHVDKEAEEGQGQRSWNQVSLAKLFSGRH